MRVTLILGFSTDCKRMISHSGSANDVAMNQHFENFVSHFHDLVQMYCQLIRVYQNWMRHASILLGNYFYWTVDLAVSQLKIQILMPLWSLHLVHVKMLEERKQAKLAMFLQLPLMIPRLELILLLFALKQSMAMIHLDFGQLLMTVQGTDRLCVFPPKIQ